MIRKNKGNKINKLRVMQISEAYFQLLMRIFLRLRIKENYEDDEIILKYDYGSRKGCSL